MLVLLGIGFLAGIITAITPCVLPVLPLIVAGSAAGGRRRPYAIIAGLVTTFTAVTLASAWVLDQLGLPQDVLRKLALALLLLVAATLIIPPLGLLLERPFRALTRRRGGDLGGGFLLGASLGLVFVPCAGPVFAAIASSAATRRVNTDIVLVAVAYGVGTAVPMLFFALAGQRSVARLVKANAPRVRMALGVVVGATALAIAFNVDTRVATALPNYAGGLQKKLESSVAATNRLARITGGRKAYAEAAASLHDYGRAPNFRDVSLWLNTPGGKPLSPSALRGKVVLLDFWTYSCINCLRALPHVKGWYADYRGDGFVVVGVHTPEFGFERVPANVRAAVRRLGVRYPVALDNAYGTWDAYANNYWPAEYLIDARGDLRYVHYGEGNYDHTESVIRLLLAERNARLPGPTQTADHTPTELLTPESYLGYSRLDRYTGSTIRENRWATYTAPLQLGRDELAYGGRWRVEAERAVAGPSARIDLNFHARKVHLVLSGRGEVRIFLDGHRSGRVRVTQNRLYTVVSLPKARDGLLELRLTRGLSAYAFTFS